MPTQDKPTTSRGLYFWLVVLFILGSLTDRILSGKNGAAHHERLKQEFEAIPTPPDTTLIKRQDYYSNWNSHKASVGAAYASRLPYSQLQKFYDNEFQSHGWYVTDIHTPMGTKYCKSEFSAFLGFEGNLPRGAKYGVSLDWGTSPCP